MGCQHLRELVDKFQRRIKGLAKHIEDLKKQFVEAQDAEKKVAEEGKKRRLNQEGLLPLKTVGDTQSATIYDIAELFSPPRMTEMIEGFGLKKEVGR